MWSYLSAHFLELFHLSSYYILFPVSCGSSILRIDDVQMLIVVQPTMERISQCPAHRQNPCAQTPCFSSISTHFLSSFPLLTWMESPLLIEHTDYNCLLLTASFS
jgi:hypothetical protein